MNKIFALILAVIMICGMFAGCGNTEEAPTAAPTDTTAAPTATSAPTAAPADSDQTLEVTWENTLIIGDVAYPSGDLTSYWTGNGADNEVYELLIARTVTLTNDTAEYIFDESVVSGHDVVSNDDGSKTVTFTIKNGHKWSNGEQVTSKDFLRGILLFSSPLIVETGGSGATGTYLLGYHAYNTGETNVFEGIHYINDSKFSVTVDSDWLPDFFEARYYMFTPEYKSWLPDNFDIADDGDGCYFTMDGQPVTMDASMMDVAGASIDNWRWNCDVYNGPYVRTDFDTSSSAYTLAINPCYTGNYEGQMPHIEKVILKGVNPETMMDELRTGNITFMHMADNDTSISAGLSMYEEGLVNYDSYDRNGYGAIFFKCNCGPAQFIEVRHALAYLLDRNDFARAVTGGFGMVVNGPYGSGMWMTQQGAAELDERLNQYNYNVQAAIDELISGGWTLNAEGGEYTDGVRYKAVTAEQAIIAGEEYPGCVTLSDGRILMPLDLKWCSSENNVVSDLLNTKLAKGEGTAEAGMVIDQTVMTFNELLTHYYNRQEPYFCMFNLSTNFGAAYDMRRGTEYGNTSNVSNINNEKLHQLAVDMLLVDPGDNETFLELWVDFQEEWNAYLPAVPLFSNTYYDFFTPHLKNYQVNSNYIDTKTLPYAYIEGYGPND